MQYINNINYHLLVGVTLTEIEGVQLIVPKDFFIMLELKA